MLTTVSYYLPLERVSRALELIQAGKPVDRGTIQVVGMSGYSGPLPGLTWDLIFFSQVVLEYHSFGELTRLGLRSDEQAEIRRASPSSVGMCAYGKLK